MSEAKFSEGDWRVGELNATDGMIPIYGGETGEAVICEVWMQGEDADGPQDEAIANAMVIAASKVMYEAILDVIDTLNLVDPGVYGDTISKLKAILSKVESPASAEATQ